jgi:hypothetical protein
MNNAFVITEEVLKEDVKRDITPELRQRAQMLTDTIEALQNIENSNFWKVLQKNIFEVDLDKAKRSLANEKDTTEMFRLQGDIRTGEKLNLESLIAKYRKELQAIKKQII